MSSVDFWLAQKGECFFCRKPMRKPGATPPHGNLPNAATREHLFPTSRYPDKSHVVVWACRACNQEKRDRDPTLAEFCRFKVLQSLAHGIQSARNKIGVTA